MATIAQLRASKPSKVIKICWVVLKEENNKAKLETQFPHYKSMGIFLDVQVQLTLLSVLVQSGRNSNSARILCISSLSASLKRIRSIETEKKSRL